MESFAICSAISAIFNSNNTSLLEDYSRCIPYFMAIDVNKFIGITLFMSLFNILPFMVLLFISILSWIISLYLD